MIGLKDFKTCCRLCLRKDNELVDLFSTTFQENNEILPINDLVESLCKVKILKGDGFPEQICAPCFNSVIDLHKFIIVSLKSHRFLHDILNSRKDLFESDVNNKSELIKELSAVKHLQIEFAESNSQINIVTNDCDDDDGCEIKMLKSKKKKVSGKVRKVVCTFCGKLVPAHFIEFHMNLHKDIRPYKCELEDCDKYFVAPTHAKNHYTKVHINGVIKPYKCEICQRAFNQKSSLMTHKTYHFDPQIPCPICGQFYRNKRAIKKHLLVHSGERKYPCNECCKSFQTNSTLRVHMRTHTLEKPFPCSECTKSFAYKCLLKGHLAKHHPK